MSDVSTQARDWLIELSGEPIETWHGRTQRLLETAARRAGITFRSAYGLFYRSGHDTRSSTIERVRRAVEERRKQTEEADRDDTRQLFERISALEEWLARVDPDFNRPCLEGLQQAAHAPRSEEG